MENKEVLKVINLEKHFSLSSGLLNPFRKKEYVKALDGISFGIYKNEIIGLAGESGCGKTTMGNILCGLYKPTSGKVLFNGKNVLDLKGKEYQKWRKDVQMIFQDPYNSLNPRFTVFRNVVEPLRIHDLSNDNGDIETVSNALDSVELKPAQFYLNRFPHQLSGGQRQRVALARCLITSPKFIVADEPVSMLDISIRAAFLELLKNLQREQELNVIYISHNLSEIRYISQRIIIMYLGKIVESGSTEKVIDDPKHPYTQRLLSAVPVIDPDRKRKRVIIEGRRPDLLNLIPGCRFQYACSQVQKKCSTINPKMVQIEEAHYTACHLYYS